MNGMLLEVNVCPSAPVCYSPKTTLQWRKPSAGCWHWTAKSWETYQTAAHCWKQRNDSDLT